MGSQTAKWALPYPLGTDRVMDGDNAIRALAERVELVLTAQPGMRTVLFTLSAGVQDFGGGNIGINTGLAGISDGLWVLNIYTKDGFGNYVPNVPASKAIHPMLAQIYWNPGQVALGTVVYVKGVYMATTAPTALEMRGDEGDPDTRPTPESTPTELVAEE